MSKAANPKEQEDSKPRNPRSLQWEKRFAELVEFKRRFGHAHVPMNWPENVPLSNWTSKQRQEHRNRLKGKKSRLTDDRISRLESVGFGWKLQRGGRRRVLVGKAKDKLKGGDGGEQDVEEPCILPGEVVLGSDSKSENNPGEKPGASAQPLPRPQAPLPGPAASLPMMHRGVFPTNQSTDDLIRSIVTRNILLQDTSLSAGHMLRAGSSFGSLRFPSSAPPTGPMGLLSSIGRDPTMMTAVPLRSPPFPSASSQSWYTTGFVSSRQEQENQILKQMIQQQQQQQQLERNRNE